MVSVIWSMELAPGATHEEHNAVDSGTRIDHGATLFICVGILMRSINRPLSAVSGH